VRAVSEEVVRSYDAAPVTRSRTRAAVAAAVLAAICGLIVLQRLHTYAEPFERDIATYAVIAREMRQGRPLYSDLWDNKPPLLYVIFAAAQMAAGEGPGSVFLMGVACAVVTALALFAAGATGTSTGVGLWTAAFWAVVCADLPLQANQPNIEAFLNAALALSFLALLRAGPGLREPLAAGAGLAVAVLLKPVVAPVALALTLVHALVPPPGVTRGRAAGQGALVLALCAIAFAGVAAYFAAGGRWTVYWDTLVVHNRAYAGPLLPNLREGLRPARLFAPVLRDVLPLAVTMAAGALLALRSGGSRRVALLAAWLVSIPFVVSAPGKFYAHYYQLWLPPLCIGAGWALDAVARRARRPALVAAVAGTAVVLALAWRIAPQYAMPADAWSEAKYGDVFLRSREMALQADAMIGPGETFFQWGNEPELYLYTGRTPPAGVLWAQYMQYGPLRIQLRSRALTQLSRADPQLVVFSRDQPPPTGALGAWFRDRYDPHPLLHRRAGFSFWVRRGGALQRRLAAE
jgi:4-amino-4-deoxy-L-arabinose transferase-like glycosyltransferase